MRCRRQCYSSDKRRNRYVPAALAGTIGAHPHQHHRDRGSDERNRRHHPSRQIAKTRQAANCNRKPQRDSVHACRQSKIDKRQQQYPGTDDHFQKIAFVQALIARSFLFQHAGQVGAFSSAQPLSVFGIFGQDPIHRDAQRDRRHRLHHKQPLPALKSGAMQPEQRAGDRAPENPGQWIRAVMNQATARAREFAGNQRFM